MKKIISVILAITIAATFFTACTKNPTGEEKIEPTPPPVENNNTDENLNEDDPNYRTVLAMWKDMDGYWVNTEGEYLYFSLDENDKAVMYRYTPDGQLERFMNTTAVMASNKTTYLMTFETPAIKDDVNFAGLTQSRAELEYMIELAGYGDDYVELTEVNPEAPKTDIYAKVGSTLDKLEDAKAFAISVKNGME